MERGKVAASPYTTLRPALRTGHIMARSFTSLFVKSNIQNNFAFAIAEIL